MRRQLTIIASILAGCLIVGLLISRVTVSQVAPFAPGAAIGRYQVVIGVDSTTGGSGTIVVCDTVTGQCWATGGSGRGGFAPWQDVGTPTEAKGNAEQIK